MNTQTTTALSEREKLWAALNRLSELCDRNTEAIIHRISTCRRLDELDSLFTFGERANALFRRIHARYEATLEN